MLAHEIVEFYHMSPCITYASLMVDYPSLHSTYSIDISCSTTVVCLFYARFGAHDTVHTASTALCTIPPTA
jgi:hypothetical protein